MAPITTGDAMSAIKGMSDRAPGPDGRTLDDLKRMQREGLAAHFNVWLLAGYPLSALHWGETVLIAKEAGTRLPLKHRPITISYIMIRCFHKILAWRLATSLPWNARQKALQAGDGVADSIWLLKTIIHQHQLSLTPLNIAFLDVKKAFDSVSHQSLILATKQMGIPPPMLVYLQELYGDVSTSLRIGPDCSEPIGVSRGVRQGDPLSVHLLNAVIDWALATLEPEPELGVKVGELRVNAGAFADDIALIARTSRGLQSLLDDLSSELRLSGLEISAGLDGKSASLCIDVDGKGRRGMSTHFPTCRSLGNQFLQCPLRRYKSTWGCLSLP